MEVKDYIERKDAIDAVCGWGPNDLTEAILADVETIPAADVRPALRGKWIDHQEGRWIYAKCSECGTVHDVKSNFCPNCGAWMEES